MTKYVSEEEAKEQVEIMAKRCAMLYKSFAETLVEQLGEEQAEELILDAITCYGQESGENVRERVSQLGENITIENYSLGADLPKYGWKADSEELDEDKQVIINITRCPLANYWFDNLDPKLARLYCYVDQAKYKAYDEELTCTHQQNMLVGDNKCSLLVERTK